MTTTSPVADQLLEQTDIDQGNSKFWDQLCGTTLANMLGITDDSPESLQKFDQWYCDMYPYLPDYIPYAAMKDKDVLEIGLGYGTVAQKLAETGARYNGLDIAQGPVDMVNHRIHQNGLKGKAVQGSVLQAPFDNESFDYIVTIGCLHHTGNLEKAISECHRMLRTGGTLIIMLYNAYSYRRWVQSPKSTFNQLMKETFGGRGVVKALTPEERASYDADPEGNAAPHTDWVSIRSFAHLCKDFSTFKAKRENIDREKPFMRYSREQLLKTPIPNLCGLDIYAVAQK